MVLVCKLVAEYTEFQRRQPDLPQGNLWELSHDDLETPVTALCRPTTFCAARRATLADCPPLNPAKQALS
jgi:hypothetical protein